MGVTRVRAAPGLSESTALHSPSRKRETASTNTSTQSRTLSGTQKFLDIDTAISTISSVQPARSQTAPQPAPQTVQVQRRNQVRTRGLRGSAGTNERHNPAGRSTDPARSSTDSSITGNRRRYSVDPKRWTDHRKLDLDMKPEEFVAWRDRAFGLPGSRAP